MFVSSLFFDPPTSLGLSHCARIGEFTITLLIFHHRKVRNHCIYTNKLEHSSSVLLIACPATASIIIVLVWAYSGIVKRQHLPWLDLSTTLSFSLPISRIGKAHRYLHPAGSPAIVLQEQYHLNEYGFVYKFCMASLLPMSPNPKPMYRVQENTQHVLQSLKHESLHHLLVLWLC